MVTEMGVGVNRNEQDSEFNHNSSLKLTQNSFQNSTVHTRSHLRTQTRSRLITEPTSEHFMFFYMLSDMLAYVQCLSSIIKVKLENKVSYCVQVAVWVN